MFAFDSSKTMAWFNALSPTDKINLRKNKTKHIYKSLSQCPELKSQNSSENE